MCFNVKENMNLAEWSSLIHNDADLSLGTLSLTAVLELDVKMRVIQS